jgi:hypothetical protein
MNMNCVKAMPWNDYAKGGMIQALHELHAESLTPAG